jgi:uncharacterized membrane protein YbhN (UPF0104 family)
MRRFARNLRVRRLAVIVLVALLAGAIVLQRRTIIDAIGLLRGFSGSTLVILGVLGILERVSRADVIRSLLPGTTLGRAEVIGDVGSAVSKGVPAGGPLATLLRWQIARDSGVPAGSFVHMLVASGVAVAFVSWGYPLVATLVDISQRDASLADLLIITAAAAVLGASGLFWLFALFSPKAQGWTTDRAEWVRSKFAGSAPELANGDPAAFVAEVRSSLRATARRPFALLLRTTVAQGTGAIILWTALRGLGVGDELGVTEFARVFFVAHILGSLAPTPGGVGVIEAGLTGALVAAGVQVDVALAGVLVYRFITYVLPILVGTGLYLWWRRTRTPPEPKVAPVAGFTAEPTGR